MWEHSNASGNFLPTFRKNLSVPLLKVKKLALEDESYKLSRNVGKKLLLTA